uniref:Uncharacterized protein n=1 Tax=Thuretia quercifolia TaxID=189650 RepID=A0A1Z1MJT8_9FLOR|nr:hypothetical protein [Thuretia quercifolia]ARW66318.1 hypothetical protein [Thuretia quercifolia]
MKNNITLFYIYIFVTLVFLIPLCYLITIDLFRIFYFFPDRSCIDYSSFSNLNEYQLKQKINYYLSRKQLFVCISMLEFFYESNIFTNFIIFTYLGYFYESLSYFQIAEYYYLNLLSYSQSDLLILNKLANLYKLSKENFKESKILNQISLLQSSLN